MIALLLAAAITGTPAIAGPENKVLNPGENALSCLQFAAVRTPRPPRPPSRQPSFGCTDGKLDPLPASRDVTVAANIDNMPNIFRQPTRCGPLIQREVRRQQAAMQGRETGLQYAVFRQLDGCMVPAPVGYHPGYLLQGAAKPEDAPANRR